MVERPLPWSSSCFVCGDSNPRGLDAKFRVGETGRVSLETVLDRSFEGYGGHIHGGVLTALLDEAAAWAVIHQTGRMCMTVELTVKFRKPVPGGSGITVTAETSGRKGRFFLAASQMSDESGRRLASAEGRFMLVSEEAHQEVIPHLKMPDGAARQGDL